MLLVCPTRVLPEQLASNIFTKQRFPVSFMLAPPVQESQTARDLYERGFLMDSEDVCGFSFLQFAQAVCAAREMRMAQNSQTAKATTLSNTVGATSSDRFASATTPRSSVLDGVVSSAQYSILGRHRQRKLAEAEQASTTTTAASTDTSRSMSSLGIPEFIRRMSRGTSSAKY